MTCPCGGTFIRRGRAYGYEINCSHCRRPLRDWKPLPVDRCASLGCREEAGPHGYCGRCSGERAA